MYEWDCVEIVSHRNKERGFIAMWQNIYKDNERFERVLFET